MANKSYRIVYNFQRRVVKHLEGQGFNCIVQPKSAFPDIVAWKPFLDEKGNFLLLNTAREIQGEISYKYFLPYFVALVECKVNKYLSKKEKEAAKKLLEEKRCNTFLVAHREKRKLKFDEVTIEDSLPKAKPVEKPFPSYLG